MPTPLVVEVLSGVAEAVVAFMDAGPSLVSFCVLGLVLSIPVVVLHELGHAVVARVRLREHVDVVAGSAGKVAELHLRGITMRINAVSSPLRAAGSATVDATWATARDVVWIALGGPAASAVGAVATGWWLSHAGPGLLHDALWVATALGISGVLNLVPLKIQERRGDAPHRTDGRLVLDALRAERAWR